MITRTSAVLSVASLVAAFAGLPVAAGEWATKEDAIAMVQRAMVFITQQGREKAYAEITKNAKVETMPTNACQFFYNCANCGERLKPKAVDCCVFCSYGDVPCPPVQEAREKNEPSACWAK